MYPIDQQTIDDAAAKCDRAVEAIDRAHLRTARNHLYRGLEAERSMMRNHQLWQAADALTEAGRDRWAERASDAAKRIGGSDGDVGGLLLEVEAELDHQEHALPDAAQ